MKRSPFCLILAFILIFGYVSPARAAVGDVMEDGYVEVMPREESIDDEEEGLAVGHVSPDRYETTQDGDHVETIDGIPLPGLLLGDANGDGTLTIRDVAITFMLANGRSVKGADKSLADFNQDGKVSMQDVAALYRHFSSGCAGIVTQVPGDLNCDGALNREDVDLLQAYLTTGSTQGINLAMADCNEDGKVTQSDLTALTGQAARSNGIKVFVSPSNQNANTYSYGGTNEAVQCNYIGFEVQKALMRCGFSTMLADYCDNLDLRAQYSNDWGADLHLPLHTNGHWPNGTYTTGGTQVYYNPDDGDAVSIATSVFAQLAPVTPGSSGLEGLRTNTSWKEIRLTNAPTVYCEMEYHDVVDYAKWITEHHSDLAEAIVKGICAYYQVTYIAP